MTKERQLPTLTELTLDRQTTLQKEVAKKVMTEIRKRAHQEGRRS